MSARGALILAGLLAVAGCGSEGSSATEFRGPERAVADVIEDLQTASQRRDATRICNEILSQELVSQLKQGSSDCVEEIRNAVDEAEDKELEVTDVKISGTTATARVKSREGDEDAPATFELRRERGRWRVTALSTS